MSSLGGFSEVERIFDKENQGDSREVNDGFRSDQEVQNDKGLMNIKETRGQLYLLTDWDSVPSKTRRKGPMLQLRTFQRKASNT